MFQVSGDSLGNLKAVKPTGPYYEIVSAPGETAPPGGRSDR